MAFPAGWQTFAITIPAAQIGAGGVTDSPIVIARPSLPNEMCSPTAANRAQADGGDIRITTAADGTGRCALDIIAWEYDTSDGAGDAAVQLRVKAPSLSSTVANTLYGWYHGGGSEVQPAVGAAYGQYDTYESNWAAYWPEGGGNDRTVNQRNLTAIASPTPGQAGKLGTATSYSGGRYGTSDVTNLTGFPVTMVTWFAPARVTAEEFLMALGDTDGTDRQGVSFRGNVGGDPVYALTTQTTTAQAITTAGVSTIGEWHQAVGVFGSNIYRVAYLDAGNSNVNTTNKTPANLDNLRLGCVNYNNGGNAITYNGLLDETSIHSALRNNAWIRTEFNTVDNPAGFASAGTPSTYTVGSTYEDAVGYGAVVNAANDPARTMGAAITAGVVAGFSPSNTMQLAASLTTAIQLGDTFTTLSLKEASISFGSSLSMTAVPGLILSAHITASTALVDTLGADAALGAVVSFATALGEAVSALSGPLEAAVSFEVVAGVTAQGIGATVYFRVEDVNIEVR